MSQVPGWLPDWQDEKSYNFPKPGNWHLWAWEFLRRNPEYQKAWQEHYVDGLLKWVVELYDNKEGQLTDEMDAFYAEKMQLCESWVCDPPALPGETCIERLARVGEGKMTPLGTHLADQFGVHSDHLLDPSINTLPGWFVFDSSYGPYYKRWFPNQPEDMLYMPVDAPEHFVVRFDLKWPLTMQLNRIKGVMKCLKEKLSKEGLISPVSTENPRQNGASFPSCLRVLDGKASGGSVLDMASVIYSDMPNDYAHQYPASQKVRNNLRTAESLRDSEYRVLCFRSW